MRIEPRPDKEHLHFTVSEPTKADSGVAPREVPVIWNDSPLHH